MIALLLFLVAGGESVSTPLDAFAGTSIDTAHIRQACLDRARAGKGYLPFCYEMIVTELGDADLKKYYYGDALEPFLTVEQARAFQEQIERVAASSTKATPCLRATLDACLGSLTTEFFVTSAASAPKWTPGEPIYGDTYVHFQVYPIPVLDPLSRFKEQLQRGAEVMLKVGPSEQVRTAEANLTVADGSIDSIMRSSFPSVLKAVSGPCASEHVIVSTARQIASKSLDVGEDGSFASGAVNLCGYTVKFFRFEPEASDLELPTQHLTLTWIASAESNRTQSTNRR